jgi:two-component system cell cycle sensor histidine kinase/response regulator CckA
MRLWLPAVPVATPVLSAPAPLPPPPVAGKTVLVVADEIMIRRIVSETLTRSGYRVLAAADGREAVEFFQQANGAVDLLLTDLHMPNMDGETLIITLRERHPGLTVLLMSGQALMLDTERVNRLKLDGMVAKPFRVTELLAQVATVLAPRPPMS